MDYLQFFCVLHSTLTFYHAVTTTGILQKRFCDCCDQESLILQGGSFLKNFNVHCSFIRLFVVKLPVLAKIVLVSLWQFFVWRWNIITVFIFFLHHFNRLLGCSKISYLWLMLFLIWSEKCSDWHFWETWSHLEKQTTYLVSQFLNIRLHYATQAQQIHP